MLLLVGVIMWATIGLKAYVLVQLPIMWIGGPKVPHYRLAGCYEQVPELQVEPITVWAGIKALFLSLWDEEQRRLVRFRSLRRTASSN